MPQNKMGAEIVHWTSAETPGYKSHLLDEVLYSLMNVCMLLWPSLGNLIQYYLGKRYTCLVPVLHAYRLIRRRYPTYTLA